MCIMKFNIQIRINKNERNTDSSKKVLYFHTVAAAQSKRTRVRVPVEMHVFHISIILLLLGIFRWTCNWSYCATGQGVIITSCNFQILSYSCHISIVFSQPS